VAAKTTLAQIWHTTLSPLIGVFLKSRSEKGRHTGETRGQESPEGYRGALGPKERQELLRPLSQEVETIHWV